MLLRLRARTRALVVMIGTTAAFAGFLGMCLWMQRPAEPGPPPRRVLEAAQSKIKRDSIESIRHEWFGGRSAWEVRGMDEEGMLRQLDIADDGEFLMYEPIGSVPSPIRTP
jgi:hypothetical protein